MFLFVISLDFSIFMGYVLVSSGISDISWHFLPKGHPVSVNIDMLRFVALDVDMLDVTYMICTHIMFSFSFFFALKSGPPPSRQRQRQTDIDRDRTSAIQLRLVCPWLVLLLMLFCGFFFCGSYYCYCYDAQFFGNFCLLLIILQILRAIIGATHAVIPSSFLFFKKHYISSLWGLKFRELSSDKCVLVELQKKY